MAAAALFATPVLAASVSCTRSGDVATCGYSVSDSERNSTDTGVMYIVEQSTGVQMPNLTDLTGLAQANGVGSFCTENAGGTLVFHLRDGFSGADFAGNVESVVACAAVVPPPTTGGASGMLQSITDGATGFFYDSAVGVFLTAFAIGIMLGLTNHLVRRLMRRKRLT